MRVLYDISALGLGHLYRESRGGSYRVDLHITEGLATSGECTLLFCANHSTVAYHGCEAFLATHQRLQAVPLLPPRKSRVQAPVRAVASRVHRAVRRIVGSNVLPSPVRRVATFIDTHLHPRVGGDDSVADIFHSPSAPLPAPPQGRCPRRLLTVYDLAYLRFPRIYGAAYQRSITAALQSVCRRDCVVTTSRYVRDELCERRIAPEDQIHVVPLAADPALFYPCATPTDLARVRHRYGIPEGPYVLSVNSPDPRKNIPHAIEAFARVVRERRDALTSLVLTGNAGPGSDRIRETISRHPSLRGRIILTGYVPDGDLAPLYTGAQVFVYPSIYEGFGLPPLEAMQCGTPVITSNTSSLPEVVADGGVMVDPEDVDTLAGTMLDIARDSRRREHLRQGALARARRFSWELSTAATLRAYRAAARA